MPNDNRRKEYRRQIERRQPIRGVTIRYDDVDGYRPKRMRRFSIKRVEKKDE